MIKRRIVCFIYATKSAFDFPLCRIHSAHCTGRSAPCCRAEEDVGEEGALVRELSWDVISLLIRRRKSWLFLCSRR